MEPFINPSQINIPTPPQSSPNSPVKKTSGLWIFFVIVLIVALVVLFFIQFQKSAGEVEISQDEKAQIFSDLQAVRDAEPQIVLTAEEKAQIFSDLQDARKATPDVILTAEEKAQIFNSFNN